MLAAAVDQGVAGRGSVWCIRGEPGVGKTRLALEILDHARCRGAIAALATSWDLGGAPAYWPWIELLRSVAAADPGGRPPPDLGADAAARDRFAMFDEVRRHLRVVASDRPLVLVLDDLHTADLSTLLLLRFVAGGVDDAPITLIGTYRPVDVALRDDPGDPEGVEALDHLGAATRHGGDLDLTGLSADEVDELVRRRFDADVAASSPALEGLVARVVERSGGNPLFVHHLATAMAEHLGAGPSRVPAGLGEVPGDVPDSIRRLFAGRLDRLDDVTRHGLRVAAVVGATFDAGIVAEVIGEDTGSDTGDPSWIARLEAAAGLELVHRVATSEAAPTAVGEAWLFSHPVLREVLLDELSPADRQRWHGAVLEGLLRRGPQAASPDRLAHHLLNAGVDRSVEAAVACERAADDAIGSAAFEDAVGHYRKGLRALDRVHDPEEPDAAATDRIRLRLLVGLGRAMWRAPQRRGSDEVFDRAWAIAERLDDLDGLVASALGGGHSKAFTRTYPSEAVRRCEEVLQRLTDDPSAERGLLYAKLASELVGHPNQSLARAAALEALRLARLVDDPRCTGEALAAVLVTDLGPDGLDERMEMAAEMLDIAARTGDLAIAVQARFQLVGALVQLGDRSRLDAVIDAQGREVHELAEPGYLRHAVWFQAMAATVDGDVDRAERLADEGLAAASVADDPDGPIVWGGQVGVVRWMQGRVDEFEPLYRDMVAASDEPVWTTTLAWLWSRNGMIASARGLLDRLGPAGVATIPRDRHWLLTMVTAAETAARTGHVEIGEVAERLLLPYSDQHVPIAMGISYWGTVARPLGLLALAAGRRAEGIEHLQRAIDLTARFGAAPWMVEAQLDLAEALLDAVGDPVAASRITALLDDAGSVAERLCLTELLGRVAGARARLVSFDPPPRVGPTVSVPTVLTEDSSRPQIRVLGRFACTDVAGVEVQWNSRKARSLLKSLVAARGNRLTREALIDWLWPDEAPSSVANRLAVAVATVRRSLDPGRRFERDAFVGADRHAVWLETEAVDVDLWRFADLAEDALASGSVDALRIASAAYRGTAFADDPADDWWFAAREQTRSQMVEVCRALASSARASDDRRAEAEALRLLLAADPYDESAHLGLVHLHRASGAHGLADLAEARRRAALTGT